MLKEKIFMSDLIRSVLAFVTLAIIIPILLTFGNGPTFFVAQGLNAYATFFVVLAIIAIPILLFSAPFVFLRLIKVGPKYGVIVSGVLIGFLTSLLVAQNLPNKLNAIFSVSLALSSGALLAIFYIKNNQFRRLSKELGPILLILTVAWFFFISSASGLFKFGAGKSQFITSANNPVPVTIVVFDEFHIAALLDRNGAVDEVRFPNFAKLASDGIWFPNTIANSRSTVRAIPTILTGTYIAPSNARPPISSNYPENLLNSFSPIYSISALEPVTGLCPGHACFKAESASPWVIMSDIHLIILKSVLPYFITYNLPSLDGRWAGFANKSISAQQENNKSFEEILSLIGTGKKQQLNFLHFITPHLPYHSLYDGRSYYSDGLFPAGIINEAGGWVDDDILIENAYHRYLHQVGLADLLLGKIIKALEDSDIYDESILVLTSDHGVAFVAGELRRGGENIKEIHNVPFFIKLPASSKLAEPGTVDSTLISHLDIVPTVAELLDVDLPFQVQGNSIFKLKDVTRRIPIDNDRFLTSAADIQGFDRLSWQIERFGDRTSLSTMARVDGLHGDLIGKSLGELAVGTPSKSVKVTLAAGPIGPWSLPNTFESFLPVRVKGSIDKDHNAPQTIVLALNGRIGAVTQTTSWSGVNGYFEAMLPPDYFRTQGNQLEVFLAEIDSQGVVSLLPVYMPRNSTAEIGFTKHKNGAISENITRGSSQWITANGYGHVDRVENKNSLVHFSGWSANLNFQAPESVVAFSGKRYLLSSAFFHNRTDVDDHLVTLVGAPPCPDCRHGWNLTLSEQQLAEIGDELRIFTLYSDGTLVEVKGPQLASLNALHDSKNATQSIFVVEDASKTTITYKGLDYQVLSSSGHIDSAKQDAQIVSIAGWSASLHERLPPLAVLLVDESGRVISPRPSRYRRIDVEHHFEMKEDLACRGCRHGWTFESPFNVEQTHLGLKVVSIFDDGTASLMPLRLTNE